MNQPLTLQRPSKTKIVATVGPACDAGEQLLRLIGAGVDVFRINTAHGKLADHQRRYDAIRAAGAAAGMPVAILVDLAGPKMRLGELAGGVLELAVGDQVRFVRGEQSSAATDLTTTYAPLIDELHAGDRVMLADGTVMLLVESKSADAAVCRVAQGGTLRSRQGVNLPGVKLSAPALGEHDIRNAQWAAQAGADFVSLSFVRTAEEVLRLKALLKDAGADAQVVAKIEKPEAVDNLEAIIAAADGAMVARGDLGVEIDIAQVPLVQKRIIALCRQQRKPVIVATQMLDSMQHSRLPTRAEAADVANAVLDGADACMLSGETAIGQYPVESVEMMQRIAMAAEGAAVANAAAGAMTPAPAALEHPLPPLGPPLVRGGRADGVREAAAGETSTLRMVHSGVSLPQPDRNGAAAVREATAHCAGHLAEMLDARLIVVFTASGATARSLSHGRLRVPTVGVSDSEAVLRRMCLYWGVIPLAGARTDDPHQLLASVAAEARRANYPLTAGDRIVLIGRSSPAVGGHNMVMVQEVG